MARHRSLAAPPAWHRSLPTAPPARHRSLQPAEPAPHQGRNSDFALVGIPTSLFARKTHHRASDGGPSVSLSSRGYWRSVFFTIHTPCRQSWRGNRIAPLNPGVGTGLPEKPITGPSPKRCRPRSIADGVFFFTIHTPSRQSWRGHRIATLNPGVGTGLPHSILAWAQDCHTQSWCGRRIAPVFPRKRWKRSAVQHYAPRLAARIARKKTGSASVHSDALPDSPPGLPAKLRRTAV